MDLEKAGKFAIVGTAVYLVANALFAAKGYNKNLVVSTAGIGIAPLPGKEQAKGRDQRGTIYRGNDRGSKVANTKNGNKR